MVPKLKLLFVYKFCTKGGVEVVLRNRLEVLERDFKDVYADVLFFSDYGGRSLFTGPMAGNIFIIHDPEAVRRFIRENNYDFIISIDTPEIFEMARGLSSRPILEVHTHYDDNRRYIKSILSGQLSPVAITVPTDYFRRIVEKETAGYIPLYTFSNFVGPSFLCEYASLKPGSMDGRRKAIGWVGRLDSLKNWPEFLRIALSVLNVRKDVEFIIIGGNTANETEKRTFIRHLTDNGLLPYVRWLPFYTHMPAFYQYLAATGGCFVSTSKAESFGMTVLESMSCKCPILCTSIGAFSEVLNSGTYGLQYNPGDICDATDKICSLLDDRECRESIILKAYDHAMTAYDSKKIMSWWISFLEEHKV